MSVGSLSKEIEQFIRKKSAFVQGNEGCVASWCVDNEIGVDFLTEFHSTLESLFAYAEETKTIIEKKHKRIPDEFKAVISQMKQALANLDESELNYFFGDDVEFDFTNDDVDLLVKKFKHLDVTNQGIEKMALLMKFQQGLILMNVKKRTSKEEFGVVLRRKFNMSNNTAITNIRVSKLILFFPRLLVCNVSYCLLREHHKRFVSLDKKDEYLYHMLRKPIPRMNFDFNFSCGGFEPQSMDLHKVFKQNALDKKMHLHKGAFYREQEYHMQHCEVPPFWNDAQVAQRSSLQYDGNQMSIDEYRNQHLSHRLNASFYDDDDDEDQGGDHPHTSF
jgi:hypothetical protein